MKSIRKFADQPLTWIQTRALTRQYELHSPDGVVATLNWLGLLSSRAVGHSADGSWIFERDAWIRQITVADQESAIQVGALKFGWCDATFTSTAGSRYDWTRRSFWRGEWAFADEKDQTIVQLTPQPAFFKFSAAATISPTAVSIPELPVLTLLACYTMILQASDSAATSAASTAVACG